MEIIGEPKVRRLLVIEYLGYVILLQLVMWAEMCTEMHTAG